VKIIYFFCLCIAATASLNGSSFEAIDFAWENTLVERSLPDDLDQYIISENHPAKSKLDKIFTAKGVLASHKSMRKNGFRKMFKCKSGTVVAKHSKLKGYLVKTFLNDFAGNELYPFLHRAIGARLVRNSIKTHGYTHLLKVPKKWLYPLPAGASPTRKYLLVVDDMQTFGWTINLDCFKSHITQEMLQALYVIIKENLLIDSVYPDNIPFSSDGCLNFVDLEHFLCTNQPIPYHRLTPHLAPEMQKIWKKIISQN